MKFVETTPIRKDFFAFKRIIVLTLLNLIGNYCFSQTVINTLLSPNGQPLKTDYAQGICYAKDGFLYVANTIGNTVVRVDPKTGESKIVVGTGESGFADNVPALQGQLSYPSGVFVTDDGTIYIADTNNKRIRKVQNGMISTVAGAGDMGFVSQNGVNTATDDYLEHPTSVVADSRGNVYTCDNSPYLARLIMIKQNVSYTIAGGYFNYGYYGDGTGPFFAGPAQFAIDKDDNVYFTDSRGQNLFRLDAYVTGFYQIAGTTGKLSYTGENKPALGSWLQGPAALCRDNTGNIYLIDGNLNTIRKIDAATGLISTIAGNTQFGYSGDGGPALNAMLGNPSSITVDPSGKIYITDGVNDVIRVIGTFKPQTISFPAIQPQTFASPDFQLIATASSGLKVSFASADTTIASIVTDGLNISRVHIKKAGSVNITATQLGDSVYSAAKSVVQKLAISKISQTITFAAVPTKQYGDPVFTPGATASSGLTVSYTSSDTSVAKVSSAGIAIRKPGTTTITANQAGGVNYLPAAAVSRTLTIGKGTQTITFAALADKPYGPVDFTLAATASSKLAVSYSSSDTTVAIIISSNKVHIKKAGIVTIKANQPGNNFYNAAAAISQKLNITKAAQTISFGALAARTYGAADFALTATATSKLAVSYVSSNTATATIVNGKVHITGAGTTTITASQAGDGNYNAANPVSQVLTVSKSAQTITFAAITAQTYGGADYLLAATPNSGLPVSFASSNTAIATIVGNKLHIISAGTVTITASQTGNNNYLAAASRTAIATIAKAPLTVTADNKTKTAGSANPVLTATIKGFVKGETISVLTTQPAISTTATLTSPAGTYPITAKGAVAVNYTITYIAGMLTVSAPIVHDVITRNLVMSTESDAKTTPMVHVSISPNGDGVNDILLIDNIVSYPENKLRLMSRNGEEIFSISGYDNASHIFDGHSSHGKLQQAGTYFYELEYKDSGKVKRLTGFFILKY